MATIMTCTVLEAARRNQIRNLIGRPARGAVQAADWLLAA
jgi:hypothetical protein